MVPAAQADEDTLLAVADLVLRVADADAVASLHAIGPRAAVARVISAGWQPGHEALVAVLPGRAAASVSLPQVANRHRAGLEAFVHPAHRRQGLGRRVVRAVLDEAARAGREVLDLAVPAGGTGEAAVAAVDGLEPVQDERESVWRSAPGTLRLAQEALGQAGRAAAGYDVLAWTGPCPDDLVEGLGRAWVAMDDAPLGASTWRPGPHGPEQVRRTDAFASASGLSHHTVVAVHRGSGEVGGFTDVGCWPGHSAGEQWDTGVVRAHRGHRLGLVLKATMALRLAQEEPALHRLHTWNAAENTHMIAVNETLGWRPAAGWRVWEGPLAALRR